MASKQTGLVIEYDSKVTPEGRRIWGVMMTREKTVRNEDGTISTYVIQEPLVSGITPLTKRKG